MDFKKILLVLFVNVCIALGFYIDNRDDSKVTISSDLANILPICKKLDDPTLYKNDLYLDDINDVKYYTPFYVSTLRGLAVCTDGDYVQALNLLSFITHILYGMSWFFMFYCFRKDFILALTFSVFFRGVLWPPGAELLGISGLWTIMPRTLFAALAPLPILAYCHLTKYRMAISGLILGLILNFHPISGVGQFLCCAVAFVAYNGYVQKGLSLKIWRDLMIGSLFFGIGMLPYLLTYAGNVKVDLQYSEALYNLAFKHRISEVFGNPMLFIPTWIRPIAFFFGIPFLCYYFFDRSERKRNFKILLISIVVVFFAANVVAYIETALNHLLHKNIRMAFQLIRIQKIILVLMQIGCYLLLAELVVKYSVKETHKKIVAVFFFLFLSVASLPAFSKIPFIGDDLITSIYPSSLKVSEFFVDDQPNHGAAMNKYISEHTPKDAVFFGSFFIRTGANRSVVLDGKGAGMLIEGNPNKFVQWYLESQKFKHLPAEEQVAFLKTKKVTYVLIDATRPSIQENQAMTMVKKIGNLSLYKI